MAGDVNPGWFKRDVDRAAARVAEWSAPAPTGDVGELERRACKFSARWGNSNPSVATMMAAFAIEEVKLANSRTPRQDYEHAARLLKAVWPEAKLLGTTYGIIDQIDNWIVGIKARAEAAEQALRTAREALKPFAEIATKQGEEWTDDRSADRMLLLTENPDGTVKLRLNLGHFRRASAALTGAGEEGE